MRRAQSIYIFKLNYLIQKILSYTGSILRLCSQINYSTWFGRMSPRYKSIN